MSDEQFIYCRIPRELADKHADWTECVALRFNRIDDEVVDIEVTNDLELLTRPEGGSGAC